MLDSSDFRTWLDHEDCKGLLLQGIPGIGKTVLAAIIISHLHNLYDTDKSVGICYYYCDYKRQNVKDEDDGPREDGHDLRQILLRLLRQLAESSSRISANVQRLYDIYQKFGNKVALEDVKTEFYAYAGSFDKIYVVVDALDECETINGYRRALLAELLELSKTRGIHVMATSRPLLDISNALLRFQKIEIKASSEDVGRYVEFNFSTLPNFVTKDVNLQDEIKSATIASADGIFLLATLHVQSLRGKKSPGALRKALKAFGKGTSAYVEAYNKTMKRITSQIEDQKELAIETLMWAVYAQRPLKIAELLHALATDVDKSSFDPDDIPEIEVVLSACCGLVIVEQESEVVRLVHRTAQEFFQDSSCTWLASAHTKLSRTCTTYLLFKELDSGSSRFTDEAYKDQLAQYPLWDYASWFWQYHTELQEIPMLIEEFAAKQEQIDVSSQALMEHTVPHYFELCRQHPGITGLHLLARCGLTSLMPSFLQNHDINARDRYRQSPISYAVQGGHVDTVSLLIEAGACLDGTYNLRGASVFDDNLPNEYSNESPQHLLLWSITFKASLAELLINEGAQLDITDTRGRNPLHWAVKRNEEVLIRLLLEKGLNPNHTDILDHSPLFYAITWHYVPGIELLLTKDSKVSINDSILAYSYCSSGVTMDGKDEMFQATGDGGNFYTMLWLLENGVPIDTTDLSGNTILMHATRKDKMEIAALLLKSGADINIADKHDKTALMFAVDYATKDMAALLLANGARVNDLDHKGRSALSRAVDKSLENGDIALVSLLLKYGADAKTRCDSGRTPLDDAVVWGDVAITRMLLSQDTHSSIPSKEDKTEDWRPSWSALHWACRTGNAELVRLLIDAGIQSSEVLTMQPSHAWTAATIDYFLDNKNSTDRIGATTRWKPLDVAYFWGKKELVNEIERTTRQDPFWSRLISSGVVVIDTTAKTGIIAARANDLTSSQNEDLGYWCYMCSKTNNVKLYWTTELCFMCKYAVAFTTQKRKPDKTNNYQG